jgi:hypothetical protein
MTGTAHFTQDTSGNTDDRAGGPISNFKPQRLSCRARFKRIQP